MIKYLYKGQKNIYLQDGYKVFTNCIKIYDVPELHRAIEEDSRKGIRIYRYINLFDHVKPKRWWSYWMNINEPIYGSEV